MVPQRNLLWTLLINIYSFLEYVITLFPFPKVLRFCDRTKVIYLFGKQKRKHVVQHPNFLIYEILNYCNQGFDLFPYC